MKYWCIFGAVAITACCVIYGLKTRVQAVEHPISTKIERVPNYAPVEISQHRVILDLGCEPFDSVVPCTVPEVKTPEPPSVSFPVATLREEFADGVEGKIVKTPPKPVSVVQVNHGKASVTLLMIRWPDRTPTHLTGKVRVVVNYDSKGLIDSLRLESESPPNLGFGGVVVEALQKKRIETTQPVRLIYDIDVRYGCEPKVTFASAGISILE